MQWLIDNWTLLASLIAAAVLASIKVADYLNSDKAEQERLRKEAEERLRRAVADWLLKAVTEAEKELGAGTGKLKIREVYEHALRVFGPELAQVLTLEQLDTMAQRPLAEMRSMLQGNASAAEYVGRPWEAVHDDGGPKL